MEHIETAIAHCNGVLALAKALHVTPQLIVHWRKRGVPAERCPAIERATGGKVRCEDLRPDIDWGVLRAPQREAA
jgi:DNA-binding transcriptional regulator YdaS (Cro superfamily)